MTTVYAGVLFLEESTPGWIRLALFGAIMFTNLHYVALWLCVVFEVLQKKYRLAAKMFECLRVPLRYEGEIGRQQIQRPVDVP